MSDSTSQPWQMLAFQQFKSDCALLFKVWTEFSAICFWEFYVSNHLLIYLCRNLYDLLFDGHKLTLHSFSCLSCHPWKPLQFPTNEAAASTAQRVVEIVAIVARIGHGGFPPLEAIKGKLLTTLVNFQWALYNPTKIDHCKKDIVKVKRMFFWGERGSYKKSNMASIHSSIFFIDKFFVGLISMFKCRGSTPFDFSLRVVFHSPPMHAWILDDVYIGNPERKTIGWSPKKWSPHVQLEIDIQIRIQVSSQETCGCKPKNSGLHPPPKKMSCNVFLGFGVLNFWDIHIS